jgi:4-hydroxysphinganine ceramide fatty acyl 2-hydroxylase
MALCSITALFLIYKMILNLHNLEEIGFAFAGFSAGLVVWTMLEYYFHRFNYHEEQHIPAEKRGSDFKFNITAHGIHHAFPNFPTIIVISYYVIFGYLVGMYFLFTLIFSLGTSYAIMLGALVGETGYDILHYFFHFGWQPTWKPIVRLKQNHLVHHYRNTSQGFGVTNLFWDRVFGTSPTKKHL